MPRDKAEYERDKNGAKRESSRAKTRDQSVDKARSTERKGLKRTDSVTREHGKLVKENSTLKRSDVKESKASSKPTRTSVASSSRSKQESSRMSSKVESSRTTTSVPRKTVRETSRSNSKMELKRNASTSKPTGALKSSSRDVVSNRVKKEKYFPPKFPFSARLHEGENSDKKSVDSSAKVTKERKDDKENRVKSAKRTRDQSGNVKEQTSAKSNDIRPQLSRERSMTRVLSPSEVRMVKNLIKNKEKKESVERPRTATIRKGKREPQTDTSLSEMTDSSLQESIASTVRRVDIKPTNSTNVKNYVHKSSEKEKSKPGPSNLTKTHQQSKLEAGPSNVDSSVQPDDEYEDDFDSYESDFEEYNSTGTPTDISTDTSSDSDNVEMTQKRVSSGDTDEEKKLDSGTYDLSELKHKQVLDKIKEAIEKENSDLNDKKRVKVNDPPSNLASLSDEGFDEKFSLNNGFINFTDTLKKSQKVRKKYKRGEKLMSMIRLDAVNYNLLEMNPISYEEFMYSFGRSGTLQVSSQTGDDNADEEIQTEGINFLNKWTQYPVRLPNNSEQNISYNHLGVGEDPPVPKTEQEHQPEDSKKLENFIKSATKLILTLLEHKNLDLSEYASKNVRSIPFSEGYFKLNIDSYPFLKGRSVCHLAYSNSNTLLTVHKSNTEVYMNADEQLLSRSLICVWNLLEPIHPQKILASSGEIGKACFDNKHSYLVFAGIKDGAVSVWDLRESSKLHRSVYEDKLDTTFVMHCPTYTTAAIQDTDVNTCEIIAIQPLYPSSDNNNNTSNKDVISLQVCTLDETGVITIWSVIQRQNLTSATTEDQGLVPWGTVVLVQGSTISVQDLNPEFKELQCFDLQCSDKDSNHLYIASNYGVLHCLTSGMKPKPKVYVPKTGTAKCISCIEMCPFSSSHFFAGSTSGNIILHSRFYEKSLLNLRSAEEDGCSEERIEIIQWSSSRPCVFYVKDSSNYIHVWDLLSSDMYPVYSVPFKEDITSIKLSPSQNGNHSYMAMSTKKGNVYVHTINNKFGYRPTEQHTMELRTFLNYVNRL